MLVNVSDEQLRQLIEHAYGVMRKTPMEYQIKVILQILKSYLVEDYKYVVLNAPTGAGKSVIGLITYYCLDYIFNATGIKFPTPNKTETGDEINAKGTYIFIHSNSLVDQYFNSFPHLENDMVLVKGASNYKCDLLSINQPNPIFADECVKPFLKKEEAECYTCEYMDMKRKMNRPIFISNYAYLMTKQIKSVIPLEYRLFTVFDESHIINDNYVSAMTLNITNRVIDDIVNDFIKLTSVEKIINEAEQMRLMINMCSEDTYHKLKDSFIDFIKHCEEICNASVVFTPETIAFKSKVQTELYTLSSTAEMITKLEHVYCLVEEAKQIKNETYIIKGIKIVPIFIRKYAEKVMCSEFKLFMSGTNHSEIFDTEVILPKYKFINMPPIFSPSSKNITFFDYGNLNRWRFFLFESFHTIYKR